MKDVQKAVVKRNGKFLIMLRSPDVRSFPKHWDFPGGKLELGETLIAGVEREVLEETGLKVEAVKIVGAYVFKMKDAERRFTVWSAKLLSDEEVKLSQEHTDFRWATKEEILRLKTEPFIKEYFKKH